MAEESPQEQARTGDRRGGDRRTGDRRRSDRRAPRPWWRRSWAMVSYGVLGALAVILAWNALDADEPGLAPEGERLVSRTADAVEVEEDASAPAPGPREAYGIGGFERLVVEGAPAVGRVVRAELYCEQSAAYSVMANQPIPRAVAPLVEGGHVRAAECKWGPRHEPSRPEFLLLIPADLRDEFTAAPVVTDAFVERRRVVAEVEWLGRPEALALRQAGIFRGPVPG